MAARLRRVQEQVADHTAKQVPLDEEGKVLAEREKKAEELQVPDESGNTQEKEVS